jgi:hypothetical protein
MVTTASDRPAADQLRELARGLGVDMSTLGGSAPGPDPKDPPVFFGSKTVESSGPRYQQNDPKWKPDQRRPVITQSDPKWKPSKPRNPVPQDDVKRLSEANAAFYEMEETQVVDLQRRLVAAGILDPDRVRYGDYDDDTYSAFAAINERTAKFNAVGKKLTPNDVLSMIQHSFVTSGGSVEPVEPGDVSATTDALTLEERVQSAARQNLGRKLRPSEVSKFVALYQGVETSFNAKATAAQKAAQAGADVMLERAPSADVAAQRYLESGFAQEAGGLAAYGYLEVLRGMLG